MSLTAELRANDLFRFVHVRSPRSATKPFAQTYFVRNVYERLRAPELKAVQAEITTLFPLLLPYVGKADMVERQLGAVAAYKETSAYIGDPPSYASTFPQVAALNAWLDVAAPTSRFADVKSFVSDSLKIDVRKYVGTHAVRTTQCRLWDNLLAHLLGDGDPESVELVCKYLACLHVLEVAVARPPLEPPDAPEVLRVYRSKAMLPRWVLETPSGPREEEELLAAGASHGRATGDQVMVRLGDLKTTIDEVRALIHSKTSVNRVAARERMPEALVPSGNGSPDRSLDAGRSPVLPVDRPRDLPNAHEMTLADAGAFSSPARAMLDEVLPGAESMDLEQALGALLADANTTGAELGTRTPRQSVRVGNSIVTPGDLCCAMTQVDPCATGPRNRFSSAGSFVNGIQIGDLLVTRQRLIKYDAGEIAHVEALMKGLDKQRTHRRLDRTETTTSWERESTNETERETQTTERFSMEKETSNTLQKDFKLSTGVNVSGKYGVTVVSSTLNASYGNSEEQSTSEATSFSREVTDRALTRVKERVRESQTIAVVNEVEETSVHSLTNDGTDHVNGVYRWLDKHYLNTIVNYGGRLMFEFEIPEPANFHIFRNLNKPPVGAVVENPIPPGEARVGIPGRHLSLPNASAIEDWNYTMWAALYGAADVTAPPQEFVHVNGAYKNTSPATPKVDVCESLAVTIEVPTGYEAVSADIRLDNPPWGQPNFYGAIDSTWFGAGASQNIPLNRVSGAVGVSLVSQGIFFHLNVAVTCRRSRKAYEIWKLETYNKILAAYDKKREAYEKWLDAQYAGTGFEFSGGDNPSINRGVEREELKMRCLEMFTGQRFESFDAATNGIQNVSGYPEILFKEALAEGDLVKFFEQAFEWENITYIFYPTFWGRKQNWLTIKNIEDTADPLFTKFLQAGYARVVVPARPGFEPYLTSFHNAANLRAAYRLPFFFSPAAFFRKGSESWVINDPLYLSVSEELMNAEGAGNSNGIDVGHYVQKVPTNLVYVVPDASVGGGPLPGLPDYTNDPDVIRFLCHFSITGLSTQVAGTPQQLTITALDADGLAHPGYTGDKTLTFSGVTTTTGVKPTVVDKAGSAVDFGLPTTITFTNGVSSAGGSMTLQKTGTEVVAVADGPLAAAGTDRLTVTVT